MTLIVTLLRLKIRLTCILSRNHLSRGRRSFTSLPNPWEEGRGAPDDDVVGVPARGPGLPVVDSDGLAPRMFGGYDAAEPVVVECCGMFPGDDDDVPCWPICDHRTCGGCCCC